VAAPRPTKLCSQRDINLWQIPLMLSLAAVGLLRGSIESGKGELAIIRLETLGEN